MKRAITQINTVSMRVSIGFRFLFNSFLDSIQNIIPLKFNRYKREYVLSPRKDTRLDDHLETL